MSIFFFFSLVFREAHILGNKKTSSVHLSIFLSRHHLKWEIAFNLTKFDIFQGHPRLSSDAKVTLLGKIISHLRGACLYWKSLFRLKIFSFWLASFWRAHFGEPHFGFNGWQCNLNFAARKSPCNYLEHPYRYIWTHLYIDYMHS